MAMNNTLLKAEEEEKKKALAEAVALRAQQDRDMMAQVFGSASPTMDRVRNAPQGPIATSAPETNPNAVVASVEPRAPRGKLTPVEQYAVDKIEGKDIPIDPQYGTSPMDDFQSVYEEVQEVAPAAKVSPQDKLKADLANLNVNRNVGTAPRQEAPLSVSPVHPQFEVGGFNEVEQNNGLPLGYLSNTAMIESGNNPNAKNPNSSAKGLYQFTDGTAAQYGLQDPMDPAQSTDAMIRFTKDNQAHLRKVLGREPTGEELYMAHQQGATGALKVLQGDPNANAVSVLGRNQVMNNGGNADMTVREFKDMWASKYNKTDVTVREPAPAMELVDSVDSRLANSDKGVGTAVRGGIPASAAQGAAQRVFENGRAIIKADEGFNFDTGFQHRNRETSDSNALWQGVLAGGLAALGTAIAGGKGSDIGEAFAVGAGSRFINAMNQSHRYKNIDALKKQGYTADSIEAYVESGDRSQLAQHKFDEWKTYPDGSGDMYRTLPNGDTEFRQGTPKWETIKTIDPETGVETTSYYNDFYGQRTRIVDGKEVPFTHVSARPASNRLEIQAGATPQVWESADGKESMTVYTTPNGYVDATDRKTVRTVPAGWKLKEKPTAGSKKAPSEAVQNFDSSSTLNSINRLLKDGAYKVMSNRKGQFYSTPMGRFAGGDAVVDVEAASQQLGSLGFLNLIEGMRGFGSLSNAEGSRLVSAYNGLFKTDANGKTTMVDGLSEEAQRSYLADLVKASLINDYAKTNKPVLGENGQPTPEWMAQRDAHVRNVYANDYKQWHSELGPDLDKTINYETKPSVATTGQKSWGTTAPSPSVQGSVPAWQKYDKR